MAERLSMTRRAALVAPASLLVACSTAQRAPAPAAWGTGPAFSIARVQVKDGPAFGAYATGHVPSIAAAGGSFLAAGAMPRTVEGNWPQRRVVIHQWPSAQAFLDWHAGEAYRPWRARRQAAADTQVLLVQGVAASAPAAQRRPSS
jgi:uncharacterized protein (DUF1330 family)